MKTLKITSAENSEVLTAARLFVSRKNRESHPQGEFDKQKRFYPNQSELQDCCSEIRRPSAAYPFSLMVHCRSAKHIANMFDVSEKELKKIAKTL